MSAHLRSNSSHREPVTVYLDTQDYSRFGDVLRGRANVEMERLFENLRLLKTDGLARFAYSMPVLSELLQYDPEHEETTNAKARAVEELCGDTALLWPQRLIEKQANIYGRSLGLALPDEPLDCIRSGNEWFPRLSNELSGFRDRLLNGIDGAAARFGPLNRKQKRALGAAKRDGNLVAMLRMAVPPIADKYQLPTDSVEHALLPLVRGQCSADEASRRLFGAVAKPTAFVHAYFKVQQADRTMPDWIRGLGANLQRGLMDLREKAEPLIRIGHVDHVRVALNANAEKIGIAVLRMIDTEEAELGITPSMLEAIATTPEAYKHIPCCEIAAKLILGYIDQTIVASGNLAKIEKSFGGDLIHAFYIDYVDIWRGDRRFAELIRQRLPSRYAKIQPSLTELPNHIISRVQGET